MKQVDFKGLAILEFPDDWEDDRILAHLRENDAEVTRFVSDQLKQKAVAETDFQERVEFEKGNQGFMETLGSRVGSAAGGAAQGVAAVGKMGGRMAELAPPAPAANVAGGMTRPVVTPELQAQFDQTAAARAAETPQAKVARVESNPAVQWGNRFMEDVGEAVPALPGDRESFLSQVAQGVGTSVGGVAAGLVAGPAGAMASMWGAEADDAYDEEMRRQQDAGETPNPDKALLKAMGYGSIASTIEAGLGVGFLAKRLQKAFGGSVKEAAKAGTKSGVLPQFIKGVAEATAAGYTEEASQRLAQDLIVQGRPNWEAINQEGLVGGFTQGLLDVPAAARQAFRRQPTAAPLADTSDLLPETTAVVDRMDEIITPPAALTAEDIAAIPVMRPGEASETGTPIPEDPAALAEQIRLTADPASSKAATLITPGEEIPDELPEGLMQVKTPHGWVVFNPDKVSPEDVAAAGAGDRFDGTILGMADDGKAPTEGTHVVTTSTPDAKNVVTEIVPDAPDAPGTPDPAAVEVAAAAQAAAVPGGTTEVKPAIEVAKERKEAVSEKPQPGTPPQAPAGVVAPATGGVVAPPVSISNGVRASAAFPSLDDTQLEQLADSAELEVQRRAKGKAPMTRAQMIAQPWGQKMGVADLGALEPVMAADPASVAEAARKTLASRKSKNETPQAAKWSNARPVLEGGPTNEAVRPTEGATGGGTESGLPAGETGGGAVSSRKTEPQRGRVGQMLGSGEIVITKTGRKTTPFPKVNLGTNRGATKTVREVDRWLMENAIAEAESIGDDFNATGFRANLKSPSQSDKDSAEEYLFGDSPPIQPPRKLLKSLTPKGGPKPEATDLDERWVESTIADQRKLNPDLPDGFWNGPFRNVLRNEASKLPKAFKERMLQPAPRIVTDTPSTSAIKDVADLAQAAYEVTQNQGVTETELFKVESIDEETVRITPRDEKLDPAFADFANRISDKHSLDLTREQLRSDYSVVLMFEASKAMREAQYDLENTTPPAKGDEKPTPPTPKGGVKNEETQEGRKEEGLLKTPEEKAPKAAPPSDDAAKQKAKADLDSALSDLADLFGTKLNIVPEQRQKVFPVLVRVMDAAFRLGYYKFKDAARFVLNTLRGRGAGNIADALTISDLQGAYIAMSSGMEGAEEASVVVGVKTKAEIEKEETKIPTAKDITALAFDNWKGKRIFETPELTKMAKESGLTDKQVEEAVEAAIVQAVRWTISSDGPPAQIFETLVTMYGRQPNLSTRTADSKVNQAYSTPAPLAYVAQVLGKIPSGKKVVEPTVGNGMLVTAAKGEIVANELDPGRAKQFEETFGIVPTQIDATSEGYHESLVMEAPDRAAMNPPFGNRMGEEGTDRFTIFNSTVAKGETPSLDHAIMLNTFDALPEDGSGFAIVGAKTGTPFAAMGTDENRRAAYRRPEYLDLFSRFNVVGWYTIDGSLYRKQGAGWPVDLIIVDGKRPTPKTADGGFPRPWMVAPKVLKTWAEVGGLLNESRDSKAGGNAGAGMAAGTGGTSGRSGGSSSAPRGGQSNPRTGNPNPTPDPRGTSRGPGGGNRETGNQPPVEPGREGARGGTGEVGKPTEAKPQQGTATVRAPREPVTPEGFVVPYRSVSNRGPTGLVSPKNIAADVEAALRELEAETGMSVDDYVAKEIQFSKEQLFKGFSAAQIDALALAIRNVRRGSALINSDQTGVGKGRVVAGLMRWARLNGHVPVFVTAKADLYTDMAARDLPAIGETGIVPSVTNTTTVYKNSAGEEVRVERDTAERREEWENAARTGDLPGGGNAIFTTYSQLGTDIPKGFKEDGKSKARRKRKREVKPFGPIWKTLETIAPNAIFILDEAHDAAGPEADNNHRFARILPRARGVYYSSATYAKRPDNLGLYGLATIIRRANLSQRQLISLFQRGGLALQQAVTTMLAKSGEFIRRQQDWAGVPIRFERASPDPKREEALADTYTRFLHSLNAFSKKMREVAAGMEDDENQLAAAEERVNIESVNFGSRLYNLSNQYLFALRSKAIGERAIRILKAGEKPFIAITNTMEGPIEDLQSGGFEVSFRGLLLRELKNMLTVTRRTPHSNKPEKITFTVEELPPDVANLYRKIEAEIKAADLSEMPISPIDHIMEQIRVAGYSIEEMTARGKTAVENESGQKTGKNRKRRTNNQILEEYNGGTLDAVIGNQTAAVGVSAHTDPRFKDQRVRHMIVGQAQPDINLFMQMLGRIMRFGQTKLPKYTILQSSLAAEKRFMVLLRRKLASLNANTSADTDSEITANEGFSADVFNEIGDLVIANVLAGDPVAAEYMGVRYSEDDEDSPGAFAVRATGRFVLLPNAKAEEIWGKIERQYRDTIAMLDERGENPLKATVEDFGAKTVESKVLVEGTGKTPFDGPAIVETIEISASTPPPSFEEVSKRAQDGERTIRERVDAWIVEWEKAREQRLGEMATSGMTEVQIENARERFNATRKAVEDAARMIGEVQYPAANPDQIAMVVDLRLHSEDPSDFSSKSRQLLVTRTNQIRSHRSIPLSAHETMTPMVLPAEDAKRQWAETAEDTATRKIITGNLLSGFAKARGRVVVYSRDDGTTNTGILLPVTWKESGEDGSTRVVASEREFLDAFQNPAVKLEAGPVTIVAGQVSVPASGTGRRVWSHAEFRRLVPRNQQKGSDIVGPIADPAGFYSFLSDTMGFRIDASAAKPPRAATSGQPVTDLSPESAVAKVRIVLTEDGVDADIVFEPDWTMPTKSGGTVRVVGTAASGGQPMRLNAAVLAGKTKDQIRRYIRHELVHPHLATPWGIAQLTGWDLTAEQVAELQEDGYLQAPGESDQDYRIRLKDEFVAREAEKDSSWWKAFIQRVKEVLANLGLRNLTNDEIARRILRNIRDRRAEGFAAPAVSRLATEPARGPGSEERPGRAGPVGGGRPKATDPERSLPTDSRGVPIQPGDRRRASSSEFGSPQYVLQKERERTLAAERFIDDSASLKDAIDRLNAVEDSALRAVIAAEVAARAAEHIRLPGRPGVLDPIDAARLVERATREVQALKTDSAQGLQAQKQINRRLGPYRAVLSYLELIRSNQQRRLGKRFPKVVSENIRSWLRVSARQAVEAVAKAMQSPANVTTRKLREAAREANINWSSLFQTSWETQRQVQVGLYQALRQHPDLAKLSADEVRELTNLFVEAWAREHNAIFQREFKKRVRPDGVAESDLQRLVRSLPRLIRYLNLGLLDDERFLNAIAPEYGIGAVDDSTVVRLSELAQEAQATPEGVRQNKVYQRMVEEIWKTGGINPYDLARDFWFANILSGLRTWIDVGVGSWLSGLTMVGRAAADASFRGRPRLAARMVAEFILATGEAIANGVDIIRTGDTTRLPGAQAKLWDVLSGRGGHDSLEAAKASGTGWKRLVGQLAYVRRIMTALDYVGSMGTRDALMAWVALSRGDVESLAAASARYDRDARRDALQQAEAEMPGAKRVDQRARAREILEAGIDREVRDAATVLGQVAALNADPVGIGGILYRLIAQVPWLLRAPAGLSFARAAINMAQNASDWMPVFGAVNWGRSLVSQTEWFQNLPQPLQAFGLNVPPERRRLIAAAQIGGMVLTTALLGLADDDDDEFEITGTWTGMPPAKRSQLMSQGERPLSIRIGDRWISYRNTPFAAAMAFVGNIRDKKRFDAKRWDNEEVANRLVSAWLMGALYIKDVSAMSQFAQLIGASAYSSTDELKSGAKWAADTIGNFGAGFIPGVSALREIDTMTDPGVYRPNAGVEYWLRNVPFARRAIGEGPAVNALGEEISNPRTPLSRWMSTEPDDPVWTVLSDHASKGVFLPVVSKTATIVGRTGERRQMNDEEFYAYQQAAGKAWRAALERDLRFLQAASPEVAQGWMKKRVEDIHSAARRRVRPTE